MSTLPERFDQTKERKKGADKTMQCTKNKVSKAMIKTTMRILDIEGFAEDVQTRGFPLQWNLSFRRWLFFFLRMRTSSLSSTLDYESPSTMNSLVPEMVPLFVLKPFP